ncbi:FtsJ-domain-containing protein [Linderina pennispora]|uniref:FtsJ-domain-containing protein n=1 Tax=Linderina pennispora TaxID=61395 RepID=A0A1Y1W5K1_9FUNG|nr:FtsJ-domain-containing protein [Linderina pennispora]ORX68615.1 FtsJ-domain-containing protein [Linderina pennispora]
MGFQKKSGKGRLDKYYHLAKEQGYRARSAFKLIQLNKKYNFLGSARALIDLCAAPGGWLQVAQKYMPVQSLILGVDLVPIKPIPNVITFAEDILTDKCRNRLRQEMKTWKADVVLHDGAPNVGSNWSHDAYSQAELVLMSLKLATEFLRKGGTFVTKVFRSKDYNSLIWVFNQLFRKVEATKPPSSRNVSAEIFVVCQDFIAPKKIDPRFLDAKYVFEDLEINKTMTSTDIFAPELKKKKRHREGYEDGDYTLHKKIDAMDFVKSRDPAGILGSANEMEFVSDESKEVVKLPETTEDILLACRDLRVLGKKDFRTLMKWRAGLRERFQLEKAEEKPKIEEKEGDEGSDVEGELDALATEEMKKLRKERKRQNAKRQRNLVKMQLNMTTPTDIGLEQDADAMFTASSTVGDKRKIRDLHSGHVDDIDVEAALAGETLVSLGSRPAGSDSEMSEDEERAEDVDSDSERIAMLEDEIEGLYSEYVDRKREMDTKYDIKKKRAAEEEFRGFSDDDDEEGAEKSGSSDEESGSEASAKSEMSADEDEDIRSMMREAKEKKITKRSRGKKDIVNATPAQLSKNSAIWFDQPMFKGVGGVNLDDLSDEEVGSKRKRPVTETADDVGASDSDDFEVVSAEEFDSDPENVELEDEQREADYDLATPEAMTMVRELANRKSSKHDLIDKHFNRYTFNDSQNLPEWFLDDENRHNKPTLPVTKERIAGMQKKAEGVIQNEDMTEAEKARSIDRMIKRATKAKPKQKVQLVVAKNSNRGIQGRPKGITGKYKMVDRRMKKELRAQKSRERKSKKNGGRKK